MPTSVLRRGQASVSRLPRRNYDSVKTESWSRDRKESKSGKMRATIEADKMEATADVLVTGARSLYITTNQVSLTHSEKEEKKDTKESTSGMANCP